MPEANGAAWEYLDKKLNRLVEQNETITSHTEELPKIAEELKQLRQELISVLTNRTPDGSIPLSTHQELMKSLNRTWAILVAVALGIVKMGPAAEKLIGWLAT